MPNGERGYMPPSKTWKSVELKIARMIPGWKRRGADFGGRLSGGHTDIIADGFAVEVKHTKRPTWGLINSALAQAADNADDNDDMPVAIIHKAGDEYKNSLVFMTMETFAEIVRSAYDTSPG